MCQQIDKSQIISRRSALNDYFNYYYRFLCHICSGRSFQMINFQQVSKRMHHRRHCRRAHQPQVPAQLLAENH